MESVTPFQARTTWRGAHRQTLRRNLLRRRPDLADAPVSSIAVALDDGDVLAVHVHPRSWRADLYATIHAPVVLLVHGMGGSAESLYVLETTRHLVDLGVTVARVDMRGSGASATTTAGTNHAARGADVGAVVAALADSGLGDASAGIVVVGYSLGGVVVLDMLCSDHDGSPVVGAVTVSAPLDLTAAAFGLLRPRAQLYHRMLLEGVKRITLRPESDATLAERARVAAVRSVPEFDEVFISGRAGYRSAYSYWVGASPLPRLGRVSVPTLLVHSDDDPVIDDPAYTTFDWAAHPNLAPFVVPSGGHVGFHARSDPVAWHDRLIAEFVAGLTAERYAADG